MTVLASVGLAIRLVGSVRFATPHVDYVAILPELILIGGALLLLLAGQVVFVKVPNAVYSAGAGVVAAGALGAALVLWHDVESRGPFTTVEHSVAVDGFAVMFLVLVPCILLVAAAVAHDFLERESIHGPEYQVLALLAGSGAMFMASANDLVLVFVALEIMSIPLYILAGMDQRRRSSGEAAMKYFLLGAFSSAIFAYGIALTYGATGSTNLAQIAGYLSANVVTSNGVLLAGLGLLLVGFGFKIAAVPFHMWTPDVYEGAPSPATGFMAALAKAGGFAALLRVFVSTFGVLRADWQPILWVLAVVTLLVGATLGLVQQNVKRMLAYSSINHAGFVLLGLQAASSQGVSASIYYVFVYAFLVLGSFAVVTLVARRGDNDHDLDAYRGLGRRQPALALAFTILLLAQTGVPLTTGFLAKLYVVTAAVDAHSYALAVVAMLSGAIAAAFYLRVVYLMYGLGAPGRTGDALGGVAAGELGARTGTGGPVGPLGVGPKAAFSAHPPLLEATASSGADPSPGSAGSAVAVESREGTKLDGAVGEGDEDQLRYLLVRVPPATAVALFATVAVTVVFGIWPAPIVDFAHAARLLF